MSTSISVPAQFGWVIAAVASTAWLGLLQVQAVVSARKKAGIAYPQAYAEKAEVEKSEAAFRFNCAQRAHSNTLESLPCVITMGVIWGLRQPVYSAVVIEIWVLTKLWYTYGYINNGPQGRQAGGRFNIFALLTLIGGGSWAAVNYAIESV